MLADTAGQELGAFWHTWGFKSYVPEIPHVKMAQHMEYNGNRDSVSYQIKHK